VSRSAPAAGVKDRAPTGGGWAIVGKLAFSTALAIAAFEVGVRLVDAIAGRDAAFYLPAEWDAEKANYRPHPYMGFEMRPGFVSKTGSVSVNSLGMRGKEISPEKPPGVYRIFCLGGSTTFGSGASSDEATYPAQLEKKLNALAGGARRYEVGNCGVSGYNSIENLIQLELRLVEWSPDAVLYYEAANDARPTQARGYRPDYSHVRQSWRTKDISRLERFLLKNVRSYAWIARGHDPEEQLGALADYVFVPKFKDLHVPSDREVNARGIATYARNLRHIIRIARAHGIVPVLSTFASCRELQKQADERFLETVSAMNDAMRALAKEEDAPLLDIAPLLDNRRALFDDWMHFNDAGEHAHAQAVVDAARAAGVFAIP
jgi:lysophospholipase L1-like esterase